MDTKIRPKNAIRLKSSAQRHPEGAQKCLQKNVKKLMPQKRLRPQSSVETRPQSSPKPPPNLAALAVRTSRLPAAASRISFEPNLPK